MASDPISTFNAWLADARARGVPEPTAMALATADADGRPSVRMVLLKHADDRGFVFYTNLESDKARELAARPLAELCFYWNPPERQVRVSGRVEPVDAAEADAYFASRPLASRIGAWASQQSRPLSGYAALERAVAATTLRFATGNVPRPPHWGGFRVVPEQIELWTARPYRLHERVRHTRAADGGWTEQALYP